MFVPKRGAERCATGWVQELLVDVCVFGHASCLLPAIAPEWQLSMHKNVFMCLAVLGVVTWGVAVSLVQPCQCVYFSSVLDDQSCLWSVGRVARLWVRSSCADIADHRKQPANLAFKWNSSFVSVRRGEKDSGVSVVSTDAAFAEAPSSNSSSKGFLPVFTGVWCYRHFFELEEAV